MKQCSGFVAVLLATCLVAIGCGSDSAAPVQTSSTTTTTSVLTATTTGSTTTETPPALDPVLLSFEFPSGVVPYFDNRSQPTKVSGILGIPAGPGPFPVAFVMNGSHPTCIAEAEKPDILSGEAVLSDFPHVCPAEAPEYLRTDIGLSPIVEELTNQGVAAVAIDVAASYNWWSGEIDELDIQEHLLNVHHDLLRRLNGGVSLGLGLEGALAGRLDLQSAALIGHSRGGGGAVGLLDGGRVGNLALSPSVLVTIEPEDPFLENAPALPLLNIRGGCDEDVGVDAGLLTVQAVEVVGGDPVVDVVLPNAGHRMLNATMIGSTCPESALDGDIARSVVAQLVASFVSSTLDGSSQIATTPEMVIDTRRGDVEWVDARSWVPTNSNEILHVASTVELIPPIPEGADFTSSYFEDF